jgi:hypothetical protein
MLGVHDSDLLEFSLELQAGLGKRIAKHTEVCDDGEGSD